MEHLIHYSDDFIEYLQIEKNASPYTIQFYRKDLESFFTFLEQEAVTDVDQIDYRLVRIYLTDLYKLKQSRRTVSRKLSSLRSFFKFLEREGKVNENPFVHIV